MGHIAIGRGGGEVRGGGHEERSRWGEGGEGVNCAHLPPEGTKQVLWLYIYI